MLQASSPQVSGVTQTWSLGLASRQTYPWRPVFGPRAPPLGLQWGALQHCQLLLENKYPVQHRRYRLEKPLSTHNLARNGLQCLS